VPSLRHPRSDEAKMTQLHLLNTGAYRSRPRTSALERVAIVIAAVKGPRCAGNSMHFAGYTPGGRAT